MATLAATSHGHEYSKLQHFAIGTELIISQMLQRCDHIIIEKTNFMIVDQLLGNKNYRFLVILFLLLKLQNSEVKPKNSPKNGMTQYWIT